MTDRKLPASTLASKIIIAINSIIFLLFISPYNAIANQQASPKIAAGAPLDGGLCLIIFASTIYGFNKFAKRKINDENF